MTTLSLTEARAALPHLLDLVEQGEEVTITRHGKPVAVMVRPDRLRPRRLAHLDEELAELRERLATAKASGAGLPPGRAEELIREIRRDRDSGR